MALAAAAPARAARPVDPDDPEGPGPLPWRVRGIVSFTVDAAAFPDSAGHTLEVYVRVPPATIASLRRDSTGVARVRLALRLTNRFGGRAQEAAQDFDVVPADTATGFGKVALLRFPVRPGAYRLRVRAEDLLSQKRGLSYIGRKVTESVSVEGAVIVAATDAGRDLSDPEFVWARDAAAGGGAFRRDDHVTIPNPERLYGLYATDLRVDFVARADAAAAPWHWRARMIDHDGQTVAQQESTQTEATARWAASADLDIATVPAGGYDLELSAWREGEAKPVVHRSRLSIAWRQSSWLVDPGDMDDVVHFLFTADEEDMFARLHPGEREKFLDEFWRKRDPTPATAENEAKEEFLARVDHANRNFTGPGRIRGMFSDMGRVFIRYGDPDEVLKQVIPAGDETLTQALQALQITEDRPTGDVNQKGLGGDTRPFEVCRT
ncbi:MAG: GWxTD domain-containing protein [Candidatus Eisenbacteria bacterium]|uniref:GWxTD domain-containing protein n=1 Tax=Eiseniibacteriota bacterium TaxID=2212470 RepID=A0A9D6LBX1_UNCEI|nr:GWxTD domain-containing protein [Candidatus Eisenbacteria bacterium]